MLEVRRERSDRLGAQAVERVVARARRRDVVRLVDDQQVERARVGRHWRNGISHEPQRDLALQPVHRGDQAREGRPWVGVDAAAAAQLLQVARVDDPELEAELLLHLVLPLQLQRCRADDQDGPCAMAEQQLLSDESGLDRLAEADVVGDQQVDARHLQAAHDRIELVVLDRDAAAERRLQGLDVRIGRGAPADGIEEGIDSTGSSNSPTFGSPAFSRMRAPGSSSQITWSSSPSASSSIDDDRHQVLSHAAWIATDARRQPAPMNGHPYDPLPSPHLHELTELGSRSVASDAIARGTSRSSGRAPTSQLPCSTSPAPRRAMRVAAVDGSSCSQTRITSQPRSLSRLLVSASRSLLARIFARQNCSLALGHVPCSGQPCQKQPSTKTATLARRKTTSARRGESSSGLASIEYRSPIRMEELPNAQLSRRIALRCRSHAHSDRLRGGWRPGRFLELALRWADLRKDAVSFHGFKPPGAHTRPTRRRTQRVVTMNSAEVAL